MKIGRNDPCPCGSDKKFKKCHGRDADSVQRFTIAVHEVGHAVSLSAAHGKVHVSRQRPCSLCLDESEASDSSSAHTGYTNVVSTHPVDEIVYSLAGSAAEEALDMKPNPLGSSGDWADLEAELRGRGTWLQDQPDLPAAYRYIVNHYRNHAETIRQLAVRFEDAGLLEVDVPCCDRDELTLRVAKLMRYEDYEATVKKLNADRAEVVHPPTQLPCQMRQ